MSEGHPPDRLSGDPCTHDMCLTGVDTTDIGDPGKVWRCEDCGKTGTQAELADDRANVYARQLREERDALAVAQRDRARDTAALLESKQVGGVEPTGGYRTSLHAALAELDAVKEQLDGAIRPVVLTEDTPEPARPWHVVASPPVPDCDWESTWDEWVTVARLCARTSRPVYVISASEAG